MATLKHYLPGFQFDAIKGPEDVAERKPSPVHLWQTLAAMGVKPERSFYVGDDPVDLACAQAAKVQFFAIPWGIGGLKTGTAQDLKTFSELLEKIPPRLGF